MSKEELLNKARTISNEISNLLDDIELGKYETNEIVNSYLFDSRKAMDKALLELLKKYKE